MASELRVDRIIPTSGVPTGGGGSIIQVVQGTKTDTASVTGPTFADVGLSVAITPKSATNKILVLVQANIGGSVGYGMKSRLMRGSTPIHIGDAAGTRPRVSTENTGTYLATTNAHNAHNFSIMFLDSPSTTSATTYKIQLASYSTYVIYLNRSGSWLDGGAGAGYDGATASSITLMEVSA